MFCCLRLSSATALICVTYFDFVEQVISESIVVCSEPKYGHLLMASKQVVWIVSVGVGVVLLKQILLFHLYDRFNFRICGGSVILSICSVFLCKSICGLIAMDAAVRRDPLKDSCMLRTEACKIRH